MQLCQFGEEVWVIAEHVEAAKLEGLQFGIQLFAYFVSAPNSDDARALYTKTIGEIRKIHSSLAECFLRPKMSRMRYSIHADLLESIDFQEFQGSAGQLEQLTVRALHRADCNEIAM